MCPHCSVWNEVKTMQDPAAAKEDEIADGDFKPLPPTPVSERQRTDIGEKLFAYCVYTLMILIGLGAFVFAWTMIILAATAPTQLDKWRIELNDNSSMVVIQGTVTSPTGQSSHFAGEIFGNQSGPPSALVAVAVNSSEHRLRRFEYVAMLNGSAFMWKSVVGYDGDEYVVGRKCVECDQVPVVATTVGWLFGNQKTMHLPSKVSGKFVTDLNAHLHADDLWFDLRRFANDFASFTGNESTWILNGDNTTAQLRLVKRGYYGVALMQGLIESVETFRSCPNLYQCEEKTMRQRTRRVEETKNEDSVPMSLRHWQDQRFGHRRLLSVDAEAVVGSVHAANTMDDLPEPERNSTVSANGAKKCLFIHGIGVKQDVGLVDNFTDYWGDEVLTSLPCCEQLKFTRFDTVNRPWYSPELARATCDAAIAVATNKTFRFSNGSMAIGSGTRQAARNQTKKLDNLIIISHSSGALNVASALMQSGCALSPSSSKWIAIQGPMLGSHTANQVLSDCAKPASVSDSVVKKALAVFELCPPTDSTRSLVLKGSNASDPSLDKLYTLAAATFRTNVNASLCGVSPEGIASAASVQYVALAKLSRHNSTANDGAVTFASCRGGLNASLYRSTPTSAFYRADLNHEDGRLVHGDGLRAAQQPLRWLQGQID